MKILNAFVLVIGLLLPANLASGQVEETQSCPDGRCRVVPGLPASPVRPAWRVEPSLDASQREMIARGLAVTSG